MLRQALRRAATTALNRVAFPSPKPLSIFIPSTSVRFYNTNALNADPVALQAINYALGEARLHRSDESYAQALLVLEQCLSNFQGVYNLNEDSVGMVLLAMSTLLSERGDLDGAMEKLWKALDLPGSSLRVRVPAWEGLIGLHLETGQDVASSEFANKLLELFIHKPEDDENLYEVMYARALAIKGLVDLVLGNLGLARSSFTVCDSKYYGKDEGSTENVALSLGEFYHVTGEFALAKNFYQAALGASEKNTFVDTSSLAAANMVSEQVLLGATCALGQLATHSGEFHNAEELLTKALTNAEEHFGSNHPKVGVILTCIAIMFGHKARLEGSSALLIQEGLYRRALDLLKAPSLDAKGAGADMQVGERDVVVLARAGYAECLRVQQNRKGEGERMRKWAEAAWRNRRMSLDQALEVTKLSEHEIGQAATVAAVIDTRISRVL